MTHKYWINGITGVKMTDKEYSDIGLEAIRKMRSKFVYNAAFNVEQLNIIESYIDEQERIND